MKDVLNVPERFNDGTLRTLEFDVDRH